MKQAVVGLTALFFLVVNPVFAITVDGHLGDWGVTPFHNWAPTIDNAFFTEHNNKTGDHAENGKNFVHKLSHEKWDVEAMYVQITETTLNFAIVQSMEQTSGLGDLAISFWEGDQTEQDADKKYQFGVDLTYFKASDDVVQLGVYAVTDWKTKHGKEYNFPLHITEGEHLGYADVFQHYAGKIEPGKKGNDAKTWIIEGMIDLDLLGITSLCGLNFELAFAKVSCMKDYAIVKGNCDGLCEIPEPSSVFLLGSALVGFGRLRRRKKGA